jgi:hypothetical protein
MSPLHFVRTCGDSHCVRAPWIYSTFPLAVTAAMSASLILAAEPGSEGLQAAKAEYERAAPRDEVARLR